MQKGFSQLPKLIAANEEADDVGKTLFKAASRMAGIVPSTMGTLMSSGIMEAGKALKGKQELNPEDFAEFLMAFAAGVQKRGKCQAGDRTILDSVLSAAERAKGLDLSGASFKDVIEAACEGAKDGVEATKDMLPKYGKAAVFSAKAKGIPDQGAVAGMYLIEGMRKFLQDR